MSTTKPTTPSRAAGKSLRQILEPRVLLDAALVTTLAEDGGSAEAEPDFDPSLYESPEGAESTRREVYFIDTNVPGYQDLITQVPEGAEVFILDPGFSGLEMMRQALDGLGYQVDAIHLISHGDAGAFRAGYDVISADTAHYYQSQFSQLAAYIADGGDFLIYGCDVAAGEGGQAFLDALSGYLGADVAASDNATGPGGDIILEVSSGSIEASSWQALSLLSEDLALDLLHVGDNTSVNQMGRFLDGDGEWVVAGGWDAGRAIVYRVDGATRTETTLNSSSLDPGIGPQTGWTNQFGRGVAISGDTLVIADPAAGTAGRLAIFKLSGSTWEHVQTIEISSISGASRIGPWDSTYSGGQYLAIDGRHMAVGAPAEGGGSGRVFWFADTSGGNWSAYNAGSFDEPEALRDDSSERFGASIAIAKDYMIIAAPEADTNGDDGYLGGGNTGNHGRVYVYNWGESSSSAPTRYTTGSGGTFDYLAGEQDNDGTVNGGESVVNARLGGALAMEYYDNTDNGIDDGRYTIVIGAPGEDGNIGEIYIYQTSGTSMNSLSTTGAVNIYGQTTGGGADRFGSAVAVSQGRLVVGAPQHNATSDAAVMYYEAPNNNWTALVAARNTNNPAAFGILVRTITPTSPNPDWAATWQMGRGLAFTDGNNLAIGAPGNSRVGFFFLRTPVAASDNVSTNESAGVNVYDILANDIWGSENPNTATVQLLANSQTGEGTFFWNNTTRRLEYNTDGLYEYLSQGDTATATITYRIIGADGFSTTARVIVTINGENDAPVVREGIADQEIPHSTNGTPNSGSIAITNRAFFDIDQNDVLTYSFVSAVSTGQGNGGVAGTHAAGGAFSVVGNNINYNLSLVPEYSQWTVTIRATDDKGASVDTTFTFTVARNNVTPTVGAIPDYTTDEDAVFSENLSGFFNDADFNWVDPNTGDTLDFTEGLSYSIVNRTGPGGNWLAIGSTNGVLTGVPVNANVGVHTVTIRATDRYGQFVEQTFDITVDNVNDAPILVNPIPRQVATVANPAINFNFNVVTDPDGPFFIDIDPTNDVITYTAEFLDGTSVTSGAPSLPQSAGNWLRFNGTTFSGIPTDDLGTIFVVRLIANDGNGGITETLFEIGVFPEEGDATVIETGTSASGNMLGTASAISANGTWAVFGSPGSNQVQIYEFSGGAWQYRTQFTGPANSLYGIAVDINSDGSRIVVGSPQNNTVYYLQRTGTSWATAGSTTATNAAAGDRFGMAVALNDDGSQVLVGSPYDSEAGANAGAAYRFNWGTANNTEANLGKILPQFDAGESGNARAGDAFGYSVAFDGDMMVIGSPFDNHNGRSNAGSAYVYRIGTAGYIKLIKEGNIASADYFGRSVDLDRFGNSVVVVVGADGDDTVGLNTGGVYVYRTDTINIDGLSSLGWNATIHAYDSVVNGQFGYTVAVDVEGDTDGSGRTRIAITGSISGTGEGAIYAYRFSNSLGWVGQRFEADNRSISTTATGNHMGFSVGIAGQRIVAGAPYAERGAAGYAGLVYGFTTSGNLIEGIGLSGGIGKVVGSDQPVVQVPVSPAPGGGEGATDPGAGSGDDSGAPVLRTVTPTLLDQDEERRRASGLGAWQLTLGSAPALAEAPSAEIGQQGSVIEELLYDLQVRQQPLLPEEVVAEAAEGDQEADLLASLAPMNDGDAESGAARVQEQLFSFSRQLDSLYMARAERSSRMLDRLSDL